MCSVRCRAYPGGPVGGEMIDKDAILALERWTDGHRSRSQFSRTSILRNSLSSVLKLTQGGSRRGRGSGLGNSVAIRYGLGAFR